mmetsp:Transcript_127235/g.321482  ORF Transcript_127235/g.321482 Transcript_127235/m.321482 type:complete len:220 (-) Transcript_127235:258-917(-)
MPTPASIRPLGTPTWTSRVAPLSAPASLRATCSGRRRRRPCRRGSTLRGFSSWPPSSERLGCSRTTRRASPCSRLCRSPWSGSTTPTPTSARAPCASSAPATRTSAWTGSSRTCPSSERCSGRSLMQNSRGYPVRTPDPPRSRRLWPKAAVAAAASTATRRYCRARAAAVACGATCQRRRCPLPGTAAEVLRCRKRSTISIPLSVSSAYARIPHSPRRQ